MSLDKSAIEHIQNTAAVKEAVEFLGTTHHPVVALPKDITIRSLEEHMERPYRFRGLFTTTMPSEFTAYVNEQKEACCFINLDTMSARAWFDLGNPNVPGHGSHGARLNLKETAPYSAMVSISGQRHTQQEIAEWIEDWRDFLVGINHSDDDLDIKETIAGIRNITIESKTEDTHEDHELRGKRSAMEEIEAKSKDGIPVQIKFTCIPYEGLEKRAFTLRLSIILNRHEKPKLVLRIVGKEAEQEKMAEEFKDKLKSTMGESVTTHIGKFEQG